MLNPDACALAMPAMLTDVRAAIYCRISKDIERRGAGVARQEEDCRAYCTSRGWDIAAIYIENSRGASDRRKVRPQYRSMYASFQNGQIDAVVVWHLDRLYRHPVELEEIIDAVEQQGLTIATVTGGDYDLTTTDGRAMARVVVAFARKEIEDKSRRQRRHHVQLAQQGRWCGGSRPYGYSCFGDPDCTLSGCNHDHGRSLIPHEAATVQHAAERILAGDSVRSILRHLNDQHIPTVTGAPWRSMVLRRLLTSSHVAGLRSLHGEIVAPGQWPAILDEATWRRLRAILLDPARRKNERGGTRRYLLTGTLRCGLCDAKMIARPKDDGRRQYVCASGPNFTGCGKMAALAEPLEHAVTEALFLGVDSPTLVAAVNERRTSTHDRDLVAELASDEAALEQLARDHYVDGIISRGQFIAASQSLEARVEATRRRLVRDQSERPVAAWVGEGGALRAGWVSKSLGEQRAILQSFIETVKIGSAVRGLNRFDPARLLPERGGNIVWRY